VVEFIRKSRQTDNGLLPKDRYAGDMKDQELKVMKRINNRAAAVEAVLTRHGTVVGPLMTDLTGHPASTLADVLRSG
jgi:hypothetical protein